MIKQNVESHAMGTRLGINRDLVDVTEARNSESEVEAYDFAYSGMWREAAIRHLLA